MSAFFQSYSSSRGLSLGTPILLGLVFCACNDGGSFGGGGSGSGGGAGSIGGLRGGYGTALTKSAVVPAPVHGTLIRVTLTNCAPDRGTFQTPVWVAFHDGSFDPFDVGSRAGAAFGGEDDFERLAEDGSTAKLSEAFGISAAGSVQRVLEGQLAPEAGPIAPGETVSGIFELDPRNPDNRYFSFASMVIPSNDAFVANDSPRAYQVFESDGTFVATNFTIFGTNVFDAGTEVNDEVPENTAFFGQSVPNSGLEENGVVAPHAGFLPAGSGGILDDPRFSQADFTVSDYPMLAVTFETLPTTHAGMGVATVELKDDNSKAVVKLRASALSGPVVAAHLHRGKVGAQGEVLLDLGPLLDEQRDGSVIIEGSLDTNDEFLSALLLGEVYVDLHTQLNPDGELRGQFLDEDVWFGNLDMVQALPAPEIGLDVRVTVRNRAPTLGTHQSPLWVAFHDGNFDVYDLGAPAVAHFPLTNALERLAEDGNTERLTQSFEALPYGSIQGVLAGQFSPSSIRPGEIVSRSFRLDPASRTSRYLSYASMILPSNDAFVANADPFAHEVFANGNFVGASFRVDGTEVLDAGTEVNDEVPEHTAFFGQVTPDTGVVEGGVVALHAGFLPPGSGGILDHPDFVAADFSVPDYEVLQVDLKKFAPGDAPSGLISVSFDSDTSQLGLSLAAQDLSGPATAVGFHEGAQGVAGPVVLDLTDSITLNENGTLFASNTLVVADPTLVRALLNGRIYVNVSTALNPQGEIRGQVLEVD